MTMQISENETEFIVTVPKTYTFKKGWGVNVIPIYDSVDAVGDPFIADIEVSIVEISPSNVTMIGEIPCAEIEDGIGFVPIENFKPHNDLVVYDDSHDLRTRWFATEKEARVHAASVMSIWKSPAPWIKFTVLE